MNTAYSNPTNLCCAVLDPIKLALMSCVLLAIRLHWLSLRRKKPLLPARDLIAVEFEDLPVVTDPEAAMQPGSPLIHPERGDSNVCVHYKIRKGDVELGFSQAKVIVESEYHLPFQEHAYLQPEAGLAYIDEEGRVTVQCAGQWPHTDRAQIAHSLGLSEDQVRVIYPAIGGAFGGREDMSVQIVLALAAWKLQTTGKDRLESPRIHHRTL